MTIRHIVAWQVAAEDAALKAEHARGIADRLLALEGVVPEILSISAGPEALYEQNWDVAVVADFAGREALERYQIHPAHQEVVAYVRSVVSGRVAVDFEV